MLINTVTPSELSSSFTKDYQEVEYIASANRYCSINTGIIPWDNFEFTFVFNNQTSYSSNAYIFWTDSSTSSPRLNFRLDATAWNYSFFINNSSWSAQTVYAWSLWLNKIHIFTVNANKTNGTLKFNFDSAGSTATYSPNVDYQKPIRLFNYQWDTNTWAWDMRVYWFIYKEDWVITRYMIPCYRKVDSVIWMYDIINDVFYTNSWTGTFSKWSDVNVTYKWYTELVDLWINERITELNTSKQWYYMKLYSEWKLYRYTSDDYIWLSSDWTSDWMVISFDSWWYYTAYTISTAWWDKVQAD